MTVIVNGQELTENARTEVNYGDKINISLNWCFVNGEEPTVSENTFVYQLPNNINVNQTGNLKDDSTGAVLGTYEINPETHKITVVYTNTDFLSGTGHYASERYGYLSFEAHLSNSVTNNGAGGNTTFTFPGDKTYTIHMDEDRTDECVTIEKTGGKIQQNPDGTLYADFLLTITAVGTQKNVIVTDAVNNWNPVMHFDSNGMSFFNDEQCTVPYTGTVVNNSSANELSYKIGLLTDQTLYAKYRVNVDKKAYTLDDWDTRDNNTAKVKSDSSSEKSSSKKLEHNKISLEDKTGSYNKETEKITWEIRISNPDKVDLEGTTLVDNLESAEGCEVNGILGSNVPGITIKNLTDGTYTFPAGSKETEYFIQYTTSKGTTSLVSKVDKKNTVTIVPFGNSDEQTKSVIVPVGEDFQLKKECLTTGNDSTTVEWKISFAIPKSGTGDQDAVLEEMIPDGMKYDEKKGIYDVQVNDVEDENVKPSIDTKSGLKINFGKFNASETEKKITFKIQTIIDPVPEESSTTYKNTVKLFNEKKDADYTYNNNNYLRYKSGKYADGQIKWTIFGKKLEASSNEVSIVDTLPENSEYVNDSVEFHSNIYWGDTVLSGDDISVLPSEDGKTITFSFSKNAVDLMKNNDNWCVQYKTKVINPLLAVDKSFINTAKIVIGGVNFNPIQCTVSNPVQKNDIIKKEGKYDSSIAPFVEYKIVVNENGLKLNNGNNLKLTDKMGSALDYVFGSVKIDGESPKNNQVQYNSAKRELTITVSDGVKHEITYTAKVNLEAGKGNKLNAENAFNTVVLNGTSPSKLSDNVIINGDVVASTAGGGATGASVSIYKLDANDETKVLKGAKFTLYKVELNEDKTIKSTEKVETKETDSNGLTVFRVTKNILYKIEETEAPNEYQKDDVIHYFIFKGTEKLPEYPTEIIDGEVNKNVDVVADNQNSYSYYVTNSKIEKQFGKLTITKEVSGLADADQNKKPTELKFAVTGTNDYSEEVTVKLVNGAYEPVELTNLVPGEYTVTEKTAGTEVEGYTLTSTSYTYKVGDNAVDKAIVSKDKTTAVTVTNTYSKDVGNLTITKEVSGLADADQNKKPTELKFAVTGPNDYSEEVTVKLVNGAYEPVELTNLVPGEYTVTEETAGSAVEGYTLTSTSYTYKVGESTVDKAIVSKNQTTAVTVTNTYSKDVGKLTFTKSFSGDALTEDQKVGISFTVKNVSTNTEVGTYRLADIANSDGSYSKTIEGLPVGKYEVIETNAGVNGYTVTTTYKVNGTDSEKGAVEIAKDSENTVAITNDYSKKVGYLTFTKVFENHEVSAEDESNITFQIQDSEGNAVAGYENITLESMEQSDGTYSYATRDDLEIGKSYKVVETNANQPTGWTVTTTYKVGEGEAKAEAQTVEVSETTANTEIKNRYTQDVGKLTFTKSFLGDELAKEQTSGISFTVKNVSTNTEVGTYRLADIANSDGSYSKTIEGLPVGKYEVIETNAGVNGYTVTTTYKVNGTDSEKGAVEIAKDSENTVAITNSYTQDVGKLTITKEVSGLSDEDQINKPTELKFAVTGPNDYSNEVTVKLVDGTYERVELTDLVPGEYTVTEKTAGTEVEGYTLTSTSYTYKVGDNAVDKAIVSKDKTTAVTVTNTYTQLVSYTVKKEWNLNGTEGVVIPETITVQLTANGNPYGDSVVLHASESDTDNWTYTWDNLPKSDATGEINYSVQEIDAPEGYTVSAVTDTESRVITLTNTYTNGKEVTFSKEDVAGKELPGATMSISVKNGEEVSRWVSTSEKNVVTLAPGNYTLTELTAPNGYLKAQSIDFTLDAEGKVLVDGNPVSEVVMVDEYASHDVIISKVDAANNKELAGAVLKVTDKEGNEVDTWTSEDGKNHTVTVKPGTYTFTEVSAPKGYELAESITFNVDLNGKVTIDGKEVTAVVMKDAKKPANVQTGVHTNVGGFGVLGGFSIGMAFIVLFLRKKMD